MKRKARGRYSQTRRRRRPTATRLSRNTIRKKSKPSSGGRGGESSSRQAALKPTYFSLLKDVEHALKVEHTDGASMQKLKRDMEKRYGGRAFDVSSCKMLKSAVKRLQNRGRIKKHPNSSLLKFKPPVVPAYNFFGNASKGRASGSQFRPPPVRRQISRVPPIRKHLTSRAPPSRKPRSRAPPMRKQMSRAPPIRKHLMSRAPPIRKHTMSSAKRSRPIQSYRAPIRRRRYY